MRQAVIVSILAGIALVPAAFAHTVPEGDQHFQLTVTLGHRDGVVWTDCAMHLWGPTTGWYILREAINQSCITQWAIRETDSRHLACIDRICETRATEWIFYVDDQRTCKDPCVFYNRVFYPDTNLNLVYTNHEQAEITDGL